MSNMPRVVVDELPPVYASHFLLTVNDECLFIESSAGLPAGESGKGAELPIHTRMAVPWNAAQRLATVLNSALAQHSRDETGDDSAAAAGVRNHAAKLPRLEV
jgi:hypothetical protein